MKEYIFSKFCIQRASLKPYKIKCLEFKMSKTSLNILVKCIVALHPSNYFSLILSLQNNKASATELDRS